MRSNTYTGNKTKGPMGGAQAGVKDGVSEAMKFRADKEGPDMTSNQRAKAVKPGRA